MNKRKLTGILLAILLILSSISTVGCGKKESTVQEKPTNEALASLKVGVNVEGFTLKDIQYSNDYESDVYLFEHAKNGGQVVYIAADDQNKWFSAIFKTPATDDTGVNHIIEHTVLEGSKKYPVKSPFTEMSKRSVSTFMNAMTGSDVTSYPIASENDQDFDNLMRVYLDAVFSPLVVENENLLMQEGWRYESVEGALAYNGVVFNEMRGALSDRYDWIYTNIPKYLYPDTNYRYNSGGNPLNIVDLTHENLKDTYHRNYTPTNAILVFYGNLDIKEKLAYVNENYYNEFPKVGRPEMKGTQTPFASVQQETLTYPASPGETAEMDSILSYSLALSETTLEDTIGLELLMSLLSDGYGTPLYDAAIDSGLGYEMYGYVDTTYEQPMFNLLLEGASDQSMPAFTSLIEEQMQAIVKDGIEKHIESERISGVMNQYALAFKSSLNLANRGENALSAIESGFITHNDPFYGLNRLDVLSSIETKIKSGGYFEALIEKYLMNNTHQSQLIFIPDANLTGQMSEELDAKLAKSTQAMTAEEKAVIDNKIKAYDAYQSMPLNESDLASLPKLTVADLDLTEPTYDGSVDTVSDVEVINDVVKSHGITGVKLYFDLKGLTEEDFTYLPLLVRSLDMTDTDQMDRDQIDTELNIQTAGLGYGVNYLQNPSDAKDAKAYFIVGTQFLNDKGKDVLPLMTDILLKSDYQDPEVLENVMAMQLTDLENSVNGEGDQLAVLYNQASLTCSGAMAFHEYSKGYQTLSKHYENWDTDSSIVATKLQELAQKIFSKSRLTVSVATDKEAHLYIAPSVKKLIESLPEVEISEQSWKPSIAQNAGKIHGVAISSDMHYVEQGFHLSQVDHALKGSDYIFMQMLSDGYMYESIRLKGGAYGGYSGITNNNAVYFTAYRAPDFMTTVDAVKNIPSYLRSLKLTQAEVDNAIVSVAGRMYQTQDVFSSVDGGVESYLMPSDIDSQALLQEMLDTKVDQLDSFADFIEKGINKSYCVVVGPDETLTSPGSLIDKLIEPLK